jgi:UDP-4-amino-4,6-dideoxy-N-acetyl-beta-L-altrosamine transaminase
MISYGRQDIDEADIEAVVAVLRSPFLTQGPMVPCFERAVADKVDAAHAVAVSSATAGLHIACLALGLGPGDLLWTVPNTFVASANAALMCGAEVDFVDIDPRTYVMDANALAAKLASADRLPKVVMPVHFAGQSCDMVAIARLAERYGFAIIEDASHAVGARYLERPVGDCRNAAIAVFSFHPVKIITTGEGGMCLTSSEALADRMRLLRSHGITKDTALFERAPEGPWDYRQVMLGYNYRMTDLQAALGSEQIKRLEHFVERRRAIASRYDELLNGLDVSRPWQNPDTLSSWHLYVIEVAASVRRRVFEAMHRKGVGVQVLYIPVHRQPYYEARGFRQGQFPNAENYYERSFTLPIYPGLSDEDQDMIVAALREALEEARV